MRPPRAALQSSTMRVFISHSESERKIANGIREALIAQGFEVWNPDREILPGDNWLLETGRALERADAVVFLLSPQSAESPFARHELEYVTSRPKYEGKLIPVRVGSSKSLPWILKNMSVIDGAGDAKATAAQIARRLRTASRRTTKRTAARRH